MDYDRVEKSLQAVIDRTIPLSRVQKLRIRQACEGVLLAGSSQLAWIARWLPQSSTKDSRIKWLSRTLEADYLSQELVYTPFVKQILKDYAPDVLHLSMDRTVWTEHETDLLSLSLTFRQRAIPLVWEFMPTGMSDYERQQALIRASLPILPGNVPVIFHGDNEFGSVRMMQSLRNLGWNFIVGQSSKNYYRAYPYGDWQRFGDLGVSKQRSVYLANVEVTKDYGYGLLNIFGFYKPRFGKRHRKQDLIYCATSLPIAPTLRRIGHRRWGIECQFRDMKSSGWQIQTCDLSHPGRREGLLCVLNLCYLWMTCLGRWLCKSSQRYLVDNKAQRQLSLFRIGWDWLVNQYRTGRDCPALTTLYQ